VVEWLVLVKQRDIPSEIHFALIFSIGVLRISDDILGVFACGGFKI